MLQSCKNSQIFDPTQNVKKGSKNGTSQWWKLDWNQMILELDFAIIMEFVSNTIQRQEKYMNIKVKAYLELQVSFDCSHKMFINQRYIFLLSEFETSKRRVWSLHSRIQWPGHPNFQSNRQSMSCNQFFTCVHTNCRFEFVVAFCTHIPNVGVCLCKLQLAS